jgi:hypothetical protein
MMKRLANIVFWTCNLLAGLCVVLGLTNARGEGLLIGIAVGDSLYGVGRTVRYKVIGKNITVEKHKIEDVEDDRDLLFRATNPKSPAARTARSEKR